MQVSPSEGGMASFHISPSEGVVASFHACPSKGGVASVHVTPSEGGVAFFTSVPLIGVWLLCRFCLPLLEANKNISIKLIKNHNV